MGNRNAGEATISSGRHFMSGGSGKWAGEQFLKALARNEEMSPSQLRTNEVLRNEEWIAFDNELITGAKTRLRAVQDLVNLGLVKTIANGMAKTVLEYDIVGDMDEAIVSLDGITRSENDRLEFDRRGLPLPITHKDIWLNLRQVRASRLGTDPLDTTYIRIAGQKCGEKTEDMLVNGGKTFGGLTIYGYTTHPNRQITTWGAGGNWAQTAKTGDQMLADVQSWLALMEGIGRYGPFVLYIGGTDASLKLNNDFKAASDKSIRSRLLELEQISSIRTLDKLAANTAVLVDLSADVVQMVEGEPLQTVQWDLHGGFEITFKAFQIMVPLVRADADGNAGIVHIS